MATDLSIIRGDDYTIDAEVTLGGVAVDLSGVGVAIAFVVKRDKRSATTLMQKTLGAGIEFTDAAGGTFAITIDDTDTSGLTAPYYGYYGLRITNADGTKDTVVEGKFDVSLDVKEEP